MRRIVVTLASVLLLVTLVAPASASEPATRGVLPPSAHPHGHSLGDLATAWNAWALSAPAESNPLLLARCEPSPIDPKVWFLPEPFPGGLAATTCDVPQGVSRLISPFFIDCSQVEAPPFHGSNAAELATCVDDGFDLVTSVGMTVDGRTASSLDSYVVTTNLDTLPPDNLLGPDSTLTLNKGFFMALAPLSRGTHMLTASFAVESFDIAADIAITINVR